MSDFEDEPEAIEYQDAYNDRARTGRGRVDEGGDVAHRNKKEKEVADRIKRFGTEQEKFAELINIAYEELDENDIKGIATNADIDAIKDNLGNVTNINFKNPMGMILGYKGRSLSKKVMDDIITRVLDNEIFKTEYGIGPADVVRYAVLWNGLI